MADYTSKHTGSTIDKGVDEALESKQYIYESLVLSLGVQLGGYDTSTITHPEWERVCLDKDDRILAGIREDGSLYIAEL